jgi:hypothetical protein
MIIITPEEKKEQKKQEILTPMPDEIFDIFDNPELLELKEQIIESSNDKILTDDCLIMYGTKVAQLAFGFFPNNNSK